MSGARSREVAVLDLGLGNLRSVARALERAGGAPTLVTDAEGLVRAARIVVPGQGAFGDFARALTGDVREALVARIAAGTPYFGICLGMQILFESSEEAPGERGLALFAGAVRRFADDVVDRATGARLKVPHMGWNVVTGAHPLLPAQAWFYFVHSYFCAPDDASLTVGTADYGGPFSAAVARDNVFACQFHPEKSDEDGRALLARFLES